jgi:alpha-1,2-mannosyltransferase
MPTAGRSAPLWTCLAAVLALLFAAINTVNALNKGGDAIVFVDGGRRLLAGSDPYEGSSAAAGFIGPPFQALFFAPFAAIAERNAVAARLAWHAVNLGCLWAGIWLTAAAWSRARAAIGLPGRPWLPALFAPLVAVLLPVQTNFEHQNMNALLLALVAGATWQLTRGASAAAGLLVGTAAALKVFPALIIGYLFWRDRRAAATAIATMVVLTLAPIVVYGLDAYIDLLSTFWRLGNSGWPTRGNNQSLVAAIDRMVNGLSSNGVGELSSSPAIALGYGAAALALVAAALASILRSLDRGPALTCVHLAIVTLVSILLSPIAWDHYWTLALPALVILYDSRGQRLLGRAGEWAFWIVAVLLTGLSPLTIGRSGFGLARALSAYTIAGVVIVIALVAVSRRLRVEGQWRPNTTSQGTIAPRP